MSARPSFSAITFAARANDAGSRADEHDVRARRTAGASRVASLWTAIERTRRELEWHARHAGEIGERFVAIIRPREAGLTSALCRVTERLVDHHEHTALGGDERTLLGLWINENLQSLATHPFAPRERVAALAHRWRRHLAAGEHPLDVPLATLYARQAGAEPRGTSATAHATGAPGCGDRAAAGTARGDGANAAADDHDGHRRGFAADDGDAEGGAGGAANAADGTANGAANGAARRSAAPTGVERDLRRLLERLFRRLARALHPDREQNEGRKREKDALMSECLRARDERDVETLLTLYATHVGEPPEALEEAGGGTLERLLQEQLDGLRRRLREIGHGNALQTMIVERYGADDPAVSERRFAAHARAIDDETARFAAMERLVTSVAGLREALGQRRERELDRLSIDELTGCAGD